MTKQKEWDPVNYSVYIMSGQEKIKCYIQGLIVVSLVLWIFYQSIISILICSPLTYFYVKYQCKKKCRERKWELTLQFREGVQALVAALSTGYSVENAFVQAIKDLRLLYVDETMIIQEFEYIVYQIQMNIPAQNALEDFARRSTVDDIKNLSEVFAIAKRTGGDLVKILRSTSRMIGDKVEVTREIITMMSSKKFEANIMAVIPIGIILYMKISSPGFLDPLYHNIKGILVMTVSLVIYIVGFTLMNRILVIEV
ncbi:type II secretion system F family protein [Anaerosporobacter sp.]